MGLFNRIRERFWKGPNRIGEVVQPSYIPHRSALVVTAYWFYYYVLRFFTPTGRILFLLTCFIFAYVVFTPSKAPIVYLSFTFITLYFVSLVMGFIFRPKVYLHRTMPVFAEAGETVVASYKLKSLAYFKSWDVFIDTIECRLISYPDGHPYFKECIPGEEYRFNSHVVFKKRGIFRLPSSVAESSFPFSLLRFSCWGSGNEEITVLPQKIDVKSLSFLHYEMSKSYSGDTNHMSGLGDEEFRACREYRTGDSIRHIDWAGWARSHKAIVKEYDDRATVHISLFLDSHFSSLKGLSKLMENIYFEKAVSLTAGISAYLSKHGVFINNLVIGDKCLEIDSEGQSGLANEEVQKALAEYKHEEVEFKRLEVDLVSEFLAGESLLLAVFLDESPLKQDLLSRMEGQGTTVKVISFGEGFEKSGGINLSFKDLSLDEELYL